MQEIKKKNKKLNYKVKFLLVKFINPKKIISTFNDENIMLVSYICLKADVFTVCLIIPTLDVEYCIPVYTVTVALRLM